MACEMLNLPESVLEIVVNVHVEVHLQVQNGVLGIFATETSQATAICYSFQTVTVGIRKGGSMCN
jgi:hypothetical protein